MKRLALIFLLLFSVNSQAEVGFFTDTDAMTGLLQVSVDGSAASDYNVARQTAVATNANATAIRVGQAYSGTYDYEIDRALFRSNTASITTSKSITAATLKVVIATDNSATDFNLRIVAAQDSISATYFGVNSNNRFYGWANSASAFGVIALSNDVSTVGVSVGDTLEFALNAAGIERINKSGTTQFYIMSHRDIGSVAPTGLEYLALEDDSGYMTITYSDGNTQTTHYRNKNGITYRSNSNGKTQSLWTK